MKPGRPEPDKGDSGRAHPRVQGAGAGKLAKVDRPGIEERRLDVENHEQDG
jgi:hypothetical protein